MSKRALVGAAGAALVASGLTRRNGAGLGMAAAGAALVTRAVISRTLRDRLRRGESLVGRARAFASRPPAVTPAESAYLRSGKGRTDDVRGSGVYPATAENTPADAVVRTPGEFTSHGGH
jgi:hypothetical protein